MTKEMVTKEVYKTRDGEIFLNEKEAAKHEKILENEEALEKFIVPDMPQELPNDSPTLMPKRYTWYYVKNEHEFDELTQLLEEKGRLDGKYGITTLLKKYSNLSDAAPDFIYHCGMTGRVGTLKDLRAEEEKRAKTWMKFFSEFEKPEQTMEEDQEKDLS